MRVTDLMVSNNAIRHMTDSKNDLYDLTEINSTGKQFIYASDNPANANESLNLRSTISKNDAYIETANSTNLWMTATTSAIESMIDLATNASNLTLDAMSDTMGVDQRSAIAQEIDMILNQAVSIGNTKHMGHYIFSGFLTDTKPFTLNTNLTPPPSQTITYSGDYNDIQRNIGPENPVTVNANGATFITTGTNLFSSLINIKDALNATTYNRNDVQTALDELQDSIKSMNNKDTDVGGRQKELSDAVSRMEQTKIHLKNLLSKKEDVNEAEALTNMKQSELVYQKVLSVANTAINTMSLFDRLQ